MSKFVLWLFPSIRNKASRKKPAQDFHFLSLLLYMNEICTSFLESSDSVLKRLILNTAVEFTKKSMFDINTQYENLWEGFKINKPLSGMLLCWLIMSLALRLYSKFHIYPWSFASQPNISFLDNISAANVTS